MKKAYSILLILILFVSRINAQVQLKVYHGANGESQVYDYFDKQVFKPIIRMKQGEVFTVKVINPNPIFYRYALKYEALVIESEDKAIADILSKINSILLDRVVASNFTAKFVERNEYKNAIDTLINDINSAKEFIRQSDKPELPGEALEYKRAGGFRYAIEKINSLSGNKYHFNNSTLLDDLNSLSEKASKDDIEREAFKVYNNSLVEKINEIKKVTNLQSTQTIWQKDFRVTDTAQKISIVISRIDNTEKFLLRDGNGDKEFELELATIIPYYKRATIELIPVANFIFSKDVKEIYLEDNLVKERDNQKTTVVGGVVLNINIAQFGEAKEMSVGIGPGYKFNSAENAFEDFYFSSLFSYKDFLRIGIGAGFAQFPSEDLKNGVNVGDPLPPDISNLNDLIQYEEKPSLFLTISFTGLNLSKKK